LELLIWLKHSPLAQWILLSVWVNPVLLCMHAVGMALVVGCGLMTNLRILGYARSLPVVFFQRLFALAWTGVALNVGSGIVLFLVNSDKYLANWTFQLKILFIVAAGLTTWMMWRVLQSERVSDTELRIGARARVAAMLSTVFWLGAITAGRMIAYTMQPGPGL
jgi:hypothetical protein